MGLFYLDLDDEESSAATKRPKVKPEANDDVRVKKENAKQYWLLVSSISLAFWLLAFKSIKAIPIARVERHHTVCNKDAAREMSAVDTKIWMSYHN